MTESKGKDTSLIGRYKDEFDYPPTRHVMWHELYWLFDMLREMQMGLSPGVGGGGLQIPQPILKIGKRAIGTPYNTIQVGYLPQQDVRFLQYNPSIWFFRLKRSGRRRKLDDGTGLKRYVPVRAKWSHPIDVSQLGSFNIYSGGSGSNPVYRGETEWDLHTEFPMTVTYPYQYQQVAFNPMEFYVKGGAVLTAAGMPDIPSKIKASGFGMGTKHKKKRIYGYFCVAIDHPVQPSTGTSPNNGNVKIFGPPSQLFTMYPGLVTDILNPDVGKVNHIQIRLSNNVSIL